MSHELKIETIQNHVVIRYGGLCIGLPWEAGLEFAEAVFRLARFSQEYAQHKQHELVKTDKEDVCRNEVTIFRTGLEFLFLLQGREWLRCPWTAAYEIACTVKNKAAELEEIARHERTIEDSALLLRSGLPVGLTNNRKIIKEAWKAAEDVSFPGMIEPQFVCFAPSIILSPPPGDPAEESNERR